MPYCQNPKHLLKYTNNTSNALDKYLDNNKKNIRQSNRNKQRLVTPSDFTPQNRLLNKSSSTFREVTFTKSKFLAGTLVSDTQYKYPRT